MAKKKTTDEKTEIQQSYTTKQIEEMLLTGKANDIVEVVKGYTKDFVGDASTEAGRKEIKNMERKVVRSRTTVDKIGLSLTEDWRKKTNAVNNERKVIITELKALEDQIKMPLTQWEAEEKAKRDKQERLIKDLENVRNTYKRGMDIDKIKTKLKEVSALNAEEMGLDKDLVFRAYKAISEANIYLKGLVEEIERYEKEKAEREKLEKEKAEAKRIADEQAEEIRKLKAELEAKNKKEEPKEVSEPVVEEVIEEPKKPEAKPTLASNSRPSKKDVNRRALNDMMANGIEEETAKKVISLIAQGKVSNIVINY